MSVFGGQGWDGVEWRMTYFGWQHQKFSDRPNTYTPVFIVSVCLVILIDFSTLLPFIFAVLSRMTLPWTAPVYLTMSDSGLQLFARCIPPTFWVGHTAVSEIDTITSRVKNL